MQTKPDLLRGDEWMDLVVNALVFITREVRQGSMGRLAPLEEIVAVLDKDREARARIAAEP